MTMLSRWNPFKTTSSAITLMPDFEDLFRNFGSRGLMRDLETVPEMRLDIAEDDGSYRVIADIPGVKKEDIAVSVDGNQIRISADVRRSSERKEENLLVSERYAGQCYRAFALPMDVDQARAEAHYDNGVLTLMLPKKTNGSSKRIEVS
jgi:HSP20 family protein